MLPADLGHASHPLLPILLANFSHAVARPLRHAKFLRFFAFGMTAGVRLAMLQTTVFRIVAALILPSMGIAATITASGGFSSLANPTPSGWRYGTESTLG